MWMSQICVMWHKYTQTHAHAHRHTEHTCTNMCDVTHVRIISHDEWVLSHVWMIRVSQWLRHITRSGWQRPIGSLKLHVIFRRRATNYRALLRKMTNQDKASYGSLPPCVRKSVKSHIRMSHVVQNWVTLHWWINHVKHMNESCHA